MFKGNNEGVHVTGSPTALISANQEDRFIFCFVCCSPFLNSIGSLYVLNASFYPIIMCCVKAWLQREQLYCSFSRIKTHYKQVTTGSRKGTEQRYNDLWLSRIMCCVAVNIKQLYVNFLENQSFLICTPQLPLHSLTSTSKHGGLADGGDRVTYSKYSLCNFKRDFWGFFYVVVSTKITWKSFACKSCSHVVKFWFYCLTFGNIT